MEPHQSQQEEEAPLLPVAREKNPAEPGLGDPGSGEPQPHAPTGWYSRGYLPHFDNPGTIQSVTFRLADSLPQLKLREIEDEIACLPPAKIDAERRKRTETWLDAGMGCCALRHPALAEVVRETLLKWDGDRYRLFAWCIMPNHVHVLLETIAPLSKILQSWKSFTGRWALLNNAGLRLGIPGPAFWMHESWDRYIRDGVHFNHVHAYIEQNPVAAGLCQHPSDWPWSSASDPGNAEPQLGLGMLRP